MTSVTRIHEIVEILSIQTADDIADSYVTALST